MAPTHLTCPACRRLLFRPVTLPCGHSTCMACLAPACPRCNASLDKSTLSSLSVNSALEATIEKEFGEEVRLGELERAAEEISVGAIEPPATRRRQATGSFPPPKASSAVGKGGVGGKPRGRMDRGRKPRRNKRSARRGGGPASQGGPGANGAFHYGPYAGDDAMVPHGSRAAAVTAADGAAGGMASGVNVRNVLVCMLVLIMLLGIGGLLSTGGGEDEAEVVNRVLLPRAGNIRRPPR